MIASGATREPPPYSGTAFGPGGARAHRNLVLVNQPGWQDVADLRAIAAKVRWLDPTIATFTVLSDMRNSVSIRAASRLPTLVVSFGPLGRFRPLRGRVYQGGIIPKFEQLRRLAKAGVQVPRSTYLSPGSRFDPADWGEFVVLKPTDIGSSSHGSGIQLMRTERVRYRPPEDYPQGHPGRLGPMLVQQFINTGPRVSGFRVLSLFGEPLYCQLAENLTERTSLDSMDDAIETAIIATQAGAMEQRTLSYVYDADVIAMARAAYLAIPEVPLQGCDLIRDYASGRVFVLEVNPGGNTWHYSSSFMAESRAVRGPALELQRRTQLDAFSTAAHVLATRTRMEAV